MHVTDVRTRELHTLLLVSESWHMAARIRHQRYHRARWSEVNAMQLFTAGIALQTITFERPIPKAKSLNYMLAVAALQKAKKAGFQDVLYISYDGNVLEV
jgi:hypothetical protein